MRETPENWAEQVRTQTLFPQIPQLAKVNRMSRTRSLGLSESTTKSLRRCNLGGLFLVHGNNSFAETFTVQVPGRYPAPARRRIFIQQLNEPDGTFVFGLLWLLSF